MAAVGVGSAPRDRPNTELEPGQVVSVHLTALAHGGAALGRHAGRVVFVPYAVPGETVRAEILEDHGRWAQGRLVEVVEPSPHRVEPPCPYFGLGRCGGCHLQHIDYEVQAELKHRVLVDQLARVGGLRQVPVDEIVGAAEPWAYRNEIQFYATPDGRLGLPTAGGDGVVPVDECLLLDPLLDDLWAALDMEWPQLRRLRLRCGSATGDLMALFELDAYEDFDIEVDLPVSCALLLADGEVVVLMGRPHMTEHVAGRDLRVSAASPFPANTAGAEVLTAIVEEHLAPRGGETLLDLYCGVGLFGPSLAGHVGRVIGVEAGAGAAADFRHNTLDLDSVELLEGAVEERLPGVEGPVELAVLNPPRAGAGRTALRELARLGPRRVAYVSRDPAALGRDARHMVSAGYTLERVQPVDLFPQTYYVDSIALFTR